MQEEEWQEEEDIQGLPVDVCVLLHQSSDAHSSTQLQYKAVAEHFSRCSAEEEDTAENVSLSL